MEKYGLKEGSLYKTNSCGMIKVLKINGRLDVDVVFIDTGYKKNVHANHVRIGGIKDRLMPTVFGVGFIGDGKYKSSIGGVDTKIYKTWHGMMERCYVNGEGTDSYKDVTVCDEWHNFQNFAEWMSDKEYEGMQLDKDIKVKGNRVYSPETCIFATPVDNATEGKPMNFKLLSPFGDVVYVYNLTRFCRDNGLTTANMWKVLNKERNHHKGWKRVGE